MSDHYPLPAYACYVWTVGDRLHVQLPATIEGGPGHTVSFSSGPEGYLALNSILRERERACRAETIGTKSCPTQADSARLEAMARQILNSAPKAPRGVSNTVEIRRIAPKAKRPAPEVLTLADLGLS